MGGGLGGGLAPNSHLNIHKYHLYNKSDHLNITIKKFQRPSNQYNHYRQTQYQQQPRTRNGSFDGSIDQTMDNMDNNKLKRGSDVGGASSFDENYEYHTNYSSYTTFREHNNNKRTRTRSRASSSESIKSTRSHRSNSNASNPGILPTSSLTKPIIIPVTSKDDTFTTHYDYSMAGMSKKRNSKRRGTGSRTSRNNSPRMTQNLFDLSNINDFVETNEAKSVITNSFTSAHDNNFKIFDNHF